VPNKRFYSHVHLVISSPKFILILPFFWSTSGTHAIIVTGARQPQITHTYSMTKIRVSVRAYRIETHKGKRPSLIQRQEPNAAALCVTEWACSL